METEVKSTLIESDSTTTTTTSTTIATASTEEIPTTDNNNNINIEDDTPKLSKNALKKLQKKEKWESSRKEKKKHLREKRKLNAKKRKETMTEEELQAKQDLEKKKKRDPTTLQYSGTILFDMEDSDLMNDREKKSLITQMTFLYGDNRIADKPFHIEISGIKGDIDERFHKCIKGFDNWQVKSSPDAYIDTYKDRIDDLVYLTSDSPNTITSIDPNKIYVIGAIVDHNRLKNLTIDKAKKQQINHGKLPIGDYLELCSRRVLTVNHVFGILVKYTEKLDWKSAFEAVIPLRKFQESEKQKSNNYKIHGNDDDEDYEDDENNEQGDDEEDEEDEEEVGDLNKGKENENENENENDNDNEKRKKLKIESDGKVIIEPK